MTISNKGLDFLIKEEGVILHPYRDSKGIPTIGIGTTIYPDGTRVKMTDPSISLDKAKEYAQIHLEKRVYPYLKLVTVPLSQNQIDALCSFIYNVGGGEDGFSGSTLLKRINSKASCEEIRFQFLRWRNSGGKPILLGRRTREANLYC